MINQLRKQLALPQTSIYLSLLGFLAGLLAAGFILLFRLSIDSIQLLLAGRLNDFTELDDLARFFVPFIAAILIATIGIITGFRHQRMGVPMVIHWMKTNYGRIPFTNTINQFVGGVIALSAGFSVGREGPAVHLGAAASSMLGIRLQLPYNAIKTLSACGIAAAISASFNTPLAAVIFVMEVILRDYKIHVFIPVIIASVTGTVLTRLFYGDVTEFGLLEYSPMVLSHIPFLGLFGLILGLLAVVFKKQFVMTIKAVHNTPMLPRLMAAGGITGLIGYFVPQSMGSGLAAIDFILTNPTNLQILLLILVTKWFATHFAIGLGIPGGIIGPLIGLGSLCGAIFALLPAALLGTEPFTGTYVVIGMAGLLAATLHAPLAAMVSIMELTNSPALAMDGMIVVVIAYVTARTLFHSSSLFIMQLDFQQLSYRVPPVYDALQKIGVTAEMAEEFELLDDPCEDEIKDALHRHIEEDVPVVVQRQGVDGVEFYLAQFKLTLEKDASEPVELIKMPPVEPNATLAEAYDEIRTQRHGAVYIYDNDASQIAGVLKWQRIQHNLVSGNAII